MNRSVYSSLLRSTITACIVVGTSVVLWTDQCKASQVNVETNGQDTTLTAADTASTVADTIQAVVGQRRLGLYVQPSIVAHVASFDELPNVPSCCPQYGSHVYWGLDIGGEFLQRFTENFHAGFRIGVGRVGARFESDETTTVIAPVPTTGTFRHRLDIDATQVHFMPIGAYSLSERDMVLIGLDLALTVTSTYEQDERILTPVGATFSDSQSSIRNATSGDAGLNQLSGAIRIGYSHDLPLTQDNSTKIVPQIWYGYTVPGYVRSIDWGAHIISVGVGIVWDSHFAGENNESEADPRSAE